MLKQVKIFIVLFTACILTAAAQTNTFPSSGSAGIGTTSPGSALDVQNGAITVNYGSNSGNYNEGIRINTASNGYSTLALGGSGYSGTSAQMWSLHSDPSNNFELRNNGNILFTVLNSGNVGIGTTGAEQLLQIGATYSQNPSIMIGGHDNNNSSSGSYSLLFGAWRDIETVTSAIVATPSWTCCGGYPGSGYAGIRVNTLGFYTIYNPTSPTAHPPNMFIATSGNVGIGTTSPAEVLDVSGNIKMSGTGGHLVFPDGSTQSTPWTGTLTGGDYAESVDITGDRDTYEPGDVLVIDPNHVGHFLKASEPYSLAVTGVYSTKPGVVGRRQKIDKAMATTEIPMAMVGIVPTKVSTENGPIRPGDVLVTSSTSGYAMKGTNRSLLAGAVIGKALGALDSGTGVIEAVISLQ